MQSQTCSPVFQRGSRDLGKGVCGLTCWPIVSACVSPSVLNTRTVLQFTFHKVEVWWLVSFLMLLKCQALQQTHLVNELGGCCHWLVTLHLDSELLIPTMVFSERKKLQIKSRQELYAYCFLFYCQKGLITVLFPEYLFGGGLVAKSCRTLATPWTVACQAPLSIGFSRQE